MPLTRIYILTNKDDDYVTIGTSRDLLERDGGLNDPFKYYAHAYYEAWPIPNVNDRWYDIIDSFAPGLRVYKNEKATSSFRMSASDAYKIFKNIAEASATENRLHKCRQTDTKNLLEFARMDVLTHIISDEMCIENQFDDNVYSDAHALLRDCDWRLDKFLLLTKKKTDRWLELHSKAVNVILKAPAIDKVAFLMCESVYEKEKK